MSFLTLLLQKNEVKGDEELLVDRESLRADSITFYKKCIGAPEKLKKELLISFKGEDGLDGGALKVEFFTLLLKEVQRRLFEGKEPNMVPIKDSTKGILFYVAGMIMAYAVYLRGSVGFPILAPHVYCYIVEDKEEEIMSMMKQDLIPVDASTSLLHQLLDGLHKCETNNDFDELLEKSDQCEAF